MPEPTRILVVGAGQIGSRHIQALGKIPNLTAAVTVDLIVCGGDAC